jgi:hypothetical protein
LEARAFLNNAESNIRSLTWTISKKFEILLTDTKFDLPDHTWLKWFTKLETGQEYYTMILTDDAVEFIFEQGVQRFNKDWFIASIIQDNKNPKEFISNFQQFCDNPTHSKTQRFNNLLIAKIKEIALHDLTTWTAIEELEAEKDKIELTIEAYKPEIDTFEKTFLQTDVDCEWLDVVRQVMNTTQPFESTLAESDAESDEEDFGF